MAAAPRPDAGWSWVIAFSCSYIHLALFGIFRSAGVIFVALLDTYDTTREEAAWPFSLCSAIFQLTAPIASVASRYVSVRKICLLGSFVATVGITCCFFADSVMWIIIFYGVVHGLGFGLVATLVPVIVNQYFVRYRATGVGIAFSGGTLSTFVFPVAMEFFLQIYGLQGTFLLLGGVVMNTLVASSMLRAPPWLSKKKEKPLDQYLPEKDVKDHCKTSTDFGSRNDGKNRIVVQHYMPLNDEQRKETDQQCSVENGVGSVNNSLKQPQVPNPSSANGNERHFGEDMVDLKDTHLLERNIPHNDHSRNVNGRDCAQIGTELNEDIHDKTWPQNESAQQMKTHTNDKSRTVISSPETVAFLLSEPGSNGRNGLENKYIPKDSDCINPNVPLIESKNPIVVKKKDSSAFQKKPNHLKVSSCEQFTFLGEIFQVLCHPMFLVLTLSMCFFFLSVHTFFMVIVDFAKDKGIPESHAIYVLSVFSVTDLLGRAGLGWVTDHNYIKRKNMVMINLGIIGALNISYPFAQTIPTVFSIAAIHGLAVGSTITLFFVLQAEYLGMKNLPLVIGLTSFIIGVTTFLRPPMTGFFRDYMGSYDSMFHFLGFLLLAISLAWLAEPWLRKRSKSFDDEDNMSSRITDVRKSSC